MIKRIKRIINDIKNPSKNHKTKILIFLTIGIVTIAVLFVYGPKWEAMKVLRPEANILKTQIVKVEILGNVKDSIITPRAIEAARGDIVSLTTKGLVKKESKIVGNETIPLAEMLAFSIPGSSERYFLGEGERPTVIEIKADGQMLFSIDYPGNLAEFISFQEKKGKFIPFAVDLEVRHLNKLPENWVSPRQMARPKWIVGAFFPDLTIEKQKREFDLRTEAQKGFSDFLNRLK